MSPGRFLWSGEVLVCMLLFFVETVCMVASLLALSSLLKKKKFQFTNRIFFNVGQFFFFREVLRG